MTNSTVTESTKTETSVTIRFKQLVIDDSLSDYYFYKVDYQKKVKRATDLSSPGLIPHNSSEEFITVTITGLSPGTTYNIKIVPHRVIPQTDLSNATDEAGEPTVELIVTTG